MSSGNFYVEFRPKSDRNDVMTSLCHVETVDDIDLFIALMQHQFHYHGQVGVFS